MKRLAKHETVLTAYAERASGPGWSNTVVVVIVIDGDGELRREWLQPEEQTEAMRLMYTVAAEAHALMTNEASRLLSQKRRASR
jgi:hypothetical protein